MVWADRGEGHPGALVAQNPPEAPWVVTITILGKHNQKLVYPRPPIVAISFDCSFIGVRIGMGVLMGGVLCTCATVQENVHRSLINVHARLAHVHSERTLPLYVSRPNQYWGGVHTRLRTQVGTSTCAWVLCVCADNKTVSSHMRKS